MAVKLETAVKRWNGLAGDAKPRVGVTADGLTPTAADLPAGSTFYETDTGTLYRWTGSDWQPTPANVTVQSLLADMLGELKAIRGGIELQIQLGHDINIDLRTEEIKAPEEA